MARLKAKITNKGGEFLAAFMANEEPIARAATAAIRAATTQAKDEARAKIASSGMGKRWQNALRGDVYPKNGTSISAAGFIYHKIPYAAIFEEGGTIKGKPLLWIPLSNVPSKLNRRKLTPKNYPGALQYVKRPGKNPILMAQLRVSKAAAKREKLGKISASAIRRGSSGSGVLRSVPIFVGISTVKIRKRFNIRQVTEQAANRLGELYYSNLKVDD